MDFFGIGNAMTAMVRVYTQSARRSGRTTSLLAALKNGDRVICLTLEDARRLKRECRERNINVKCGYHSPEHPVRLSCYKRSAGRTIFDHRWVEDYYQRAMDNASTDIDSLERMLSGHNDPSVSRETKHAEIEASRWGYYR